MTDLVITNRTPEQSDLLIDLLRLFPALTHLKLINIGFSTTSVVQQIPTVCPSIRQLFCRGIDEDVSFVRTLSSMLDTLSWCPKATSNTIDLSNCDLSKLRRLCLMAPPRQIMEQFLNGGKGLNSLKQISFVPNRGISRRQMMTGEEIGTLTKQLFTEYPSLEFIYISTRGHLERVCSAIYHGLFRTRKLKRNVMEIGLHIDCTEIEDLTDFMGNISKIILALGGSQTKQWMVTLRRHKKYDLKPIAKAIRELIGSYSGLDIKLLHHSWTTLIIGNSGCKALSHGHWWNDCIKAVFY